MYMQEINPETGEPKYQPSFNITTTSESEFDDLKDFFEQSAYVNKEVLSKKDIPEDATLPTASRMADMNKFYKKYMGDHPQASRRQAKRATIRHFNIKIIK